MPDDAFTPQEAARELRELASFEDTLRQRSEGVLWMIMGLVSASLFLAYTLVTVEGGAGPLVYALLWVPFVGAGAAIVWGIRRSLALDAERTPGSEVWLVLALGAAMLPVSVAAFTDARDAPPALALLGLSIIAGLPAMLERLRFTRAGRRVSVGLASGGALLALGLLAFDAPASVGASVGGTVTLVWIAAGLWETMQV